MNNYSEDWQEGNTTSQQRATRWIGAVLVISVLVVVAATVGIYMADLKAQSPSSATASMRRTAAITPGILRVIGLPNTPTPNTPPTVTIAPTVALPQSLAQSNATAAITAAVATQAVTATVTEEAPLVAVGSVVAFGNGAINVRQGPSLNFAVVAYLRPPQSASVIAQSEDGNWWRVNVNGTLGWLRKDTVRFTGDATTVPMAWAAPPAAITAAASITATAGAGR